MIRAAPITCFGLAIAILGHALQLANGFYDPAALAWLTTALVLCGAGVMTWESAGDPRRDALIFRAVAVAAAAWQVVQLLIAAPGFYLAPRANLAFFRTGVIVEAAAIAMGALDRGIARRYWFPAVLIAQGVLGIWLLRASPSPHIDVVVVHREAIDALLRGHDPYRITFADIYGEGSGFYNPQLVSGGRVQFGYPYPPLTLLLAIPGHLIAGDYRYSELAALVAAAGLIGYARPTITAKLAAALLLTTPRLYFVLEQGWTEPIALLALGATVFFWTRSREASPWLGGLLTVAKQYLIIAAVPLGRQAMGSRPSWRSFVLRATGAAALAIVPFALWHPRAFLDAVVLLQLREPIRLDSLSYVSWAVRAGWTAGSPFWSVAAGAVAMLVAMARTPRTAAGFAASVAFATFAMFAFGSKAFCNYYFFVIGAMSCAVAVADDRHGDHGTHGEKTSCG
jgi:hypothetical protein